MHRLTNLGLKDGGLMAVRHPHMVERYNRALECLVDRRTSLRQFRIDATGFSPEVAADLGDPDYLNPLGVNRKYILISLDQKGLPVLDQRFTSTRRLMNAFMEQNEAALFTLTSRDAVWGELEDNTYKVKGINDILSIKKVVFTVHTPSGLVEKAARLSGMVEDFRRSDTMWLNEEAVGEMVELAKAAGDVRRNPTIPANTAFRKESFHTSHLGGCYVFHTAQKVVVVHEDAGLSVPPTWQGKPVHAVHIADADGVINFLLDHDFIRLPTSETVVRHKETLLRRLEFLVFDHLSSVLPDENLAGYDAERTRAVIYRHHDDLPVAFHQIQRALKYCDAGLDWDPGECDALTLAYMTEAETGDHQDLVNHLLAHLTPSDYLSCYQNNQPLFFARFQSWPESRKNYVADFLARRFGKAAAVRDAVYGGRPVADGGADGETRPPGP